MTDDDGLRARITRQGEETLGKFAQELLENPLVTSAPCHARSRLARRPPRPRRWRWARSTSRPPPTSSA